MERHQGINRLHVALRGRLARVLDRVRGYYDGVAGAEVELLLRRWDMHNVLAILRGHAGGHAPHEILQATISVGRLDAGALHELARPIGLRGAVDLLVTWRLPTPAIAAAVGDAWPAYARSDDLAALELAVLSVSATDTLRHLHHPRDEAEPLAACLRREIDQQNLMVALRLRADESGALLLGGDKGRPFLAGAEIPSRTLVAIALAPTRADVASQLSATPRGRQWARQLAAWEAHGSLHALASDLTADLARYAMRMSWRGDPLGSAIPVSFVFAMETEVRNLRIMGEGAWADRPRDDVRSRLIFEEQPAVRPVRSAPWVG